MPQITPQLVLSTSFTIHSLAYRATNPDLRTVSFNKQTSKVVPVHTMKPYTGRRGIAPLILNLGTGGGQWSTSRLGRSTPRYRTPVLIEKKAGCAPEPV
jgi:hypothetical protein